MADKLPDNMKQALEDELAGLEARLGAADDDTPADVVAMLKRRIGEVSVALGKPKASPRAKKETRPGG